MKNFILQSETHLLVYFLFSSVFMIAQENDIAYNNVDSTTFPNLKSNINFTLNKTIHPVETNEWGPWGPDDCFDGIDYRAKKRRL